MRKADWVGGRSYVRKRSRSPNRRSPEVPELLVPEGMKLLIEQIPLDMTIAELEDICFNYGEVLSTRLWKEMQWKTGLIEYKREGEVLKALRALDGRKMQDWDFKLKCIRYGG